MYWNGLPCSLEGSCCLVHTVFLGYVVVTSGTCQSAGYKPLKTATECRAAALALGYKDDWGPHGGYDDVVDGCSVRFGTDLFQNPVGQCQIGANTPSWIPLLNGKTDCQCSVYQPCLCEGSHASPTGKVRLVLTTSGRRAVVWQWLLSCRTTSSPKFFYALCSCVCLLKSPREVQLVHSLLIASVNVWGLECLFKS